MSSENLEILKFAKDELKFYISQILDEDIELDILFKLDKNISKSGNDAFSISINNNKGYILGNNERSVLLGVYYYLRKLGVRFLAPNDKHTFIPKLKSNELDINIFKESSFKHRGVCIEGADSYENIADFIDWLPKLGYNSFFLQFKIPYSFLARWYNHHLNPYLESENYTVGKAKEDMEKLELELKKRGLLLHKVGHGWTGEVLGFPTFDWNSADDTLTNETRDFCAKLGDSRGLYKNTPANTNLCYSNTKVKQKFVDLVVNYIIENPNIDYVHVWLADEYNNACECDKCSQTSISDQYIDYINEIDSRLNEINNKTKIVFLLYQELLWTAIKERIKSSDRFTMMFAPISRTFESSYNISNIPDKIPKYIRNKIVLPINLGENLAFLRKWQKHFKGDSFIYDYPLGRAHYGDFGYYNISKIISEDVKKLEVIGLDGYISCQELRVCFPNALPNYILGLTLFDKELKFEDIVREYYIAAYQNEADTVLNFLKNLSSLSSPDYVNGKGERTNLKIAQNMKSIRALCDEFLEYFLKLSSYTKLQGIFREVLLYHIEYTKKISTTLFYLASGDTKRAHKCWQEVKEFIHKNEMKYREYFDVYRVIEVMEKYTGLS